MSGPKDVYSVDGQESMKNIRTPLTRTMSGDLSTQGGLSLASASLESFRQYLDRIRDALAGMSESVQSGVDAVTKMADVLAKKKEQDLESQSHRLRSLSRSRYNRRSDVAGQAVRSDRQAYSGRTSGSGRR